MPIGEYTLSVSSANMREATAGPFTLTVDARQRVDFDLQLASAQTSVDVAGTVSLVEGDSSDRGQVVRSTQIVELPLNGRAYSELVYLSAGVVPSPSAGQDYNSREGSFNANGLRSTFNNFLLDGLDNNYYGTSNQIVSSRVRVFGRYDQSRADIFDPGTIPGLAGGDGNGNTRIPIIQVAGGVTWTLSPRSILEGRMGFSRSRAGKTPVLAGGPSMQELFGIPGLPTDPRYTGGISYQLIPGFSSLGRQFTNPQYQYPSEPFAARSTRGRCSSH